MKELIKVICFLSLAPMQFWSCHFSSDVFTTDNHFPLVSGRDIYSFIKLSIMAWHFSGENLDDETSLSRCWYIKLLYFSPDAKNGSVITSFLSEDIGRRNLVVCFVIFSSEVHKRS